MADAKRLSQEEDLLQKERALVTLPESWSNLAKDPLADLRLITDEGANFYDEARGHANGAVLRHEALLVAPLGKVLLWLSGRKHVVTSLFAEISRAAGERGRIVAASAYRRSKVSFDSLKFLAQVTRPPRARPEPVLGPDCPDDLRSPQEERLYPPFTDHTDNGENADEEACSYADAAPYINESLLVTPVGDARLRLGHRKRANMRLYMTAVAIVVAGLLTMLVFRPKGPTLPPADQRAGTAAVTQATPATENSTQETGPKTSAVAAAQAGTDFGIQLSSTPPPEPVEHPSSAPMTDEARNQLLAALNQHGNSQSAPVQEQAQAANVAVPTIVQGSPGAQPKRLQAATPSQQPAVKEKVVPTLAKQQKNPEPSASSTQACAAPPSNVIRDAVLRKLRDPASAQFGAATVVCRDKINGAPTKIICGLVSGKQIFFGRNAGQASYLLIPEHGFVEVPALAEDWNRYCAAPYKSSVAIRVSELNANQ